MLGRCLIRFSACDDAIPVLIERAIHRDHFLSESFSLSFLTFLSSFIFPFKFYYLFINLLYQIVYINSIFGIADAPFSIR